MQEIAYNKKRDTLDFCMLGVFSICVFECENTVSKFIRCFRLS